MTMTSSAPPSTASTVSRGVPWIGVLRLTLGGILLWAGLDKFFGFGLGTASADAVIRGGSPTEGYLGYGLDPDGPAHGILEPLAGNPVLDGLYLLATAGAGLALVLGVAIRLAGLGAALFFAILWFCALPLENNPFLDEHVVYTVAAVVVATSPAARALSLDRWWSRTPWAQRLPWLA